MTLGPSIKTIKEPERDIRVVRECDVVVVGGGPGGFAAALAAARNGADTVLVERYGHLGGMATGGLVTIIPNMSSFNGKVYIKGICEEWMNKLDAIDAATSPMNDELGSHDPTVVKYWQFRSGHYVHSDTVLKTVLIDAEMGKCVINDMVEEAGIKTYLHSWGTASIVDKNEVQGIIFESKSGRQAIMAKVVIDSTGDGDLLPSAGADFDEKIDPKLRISGLAMCFWIANVDIQKFDDFRLSQPEKFAEQRQELMKLGGFGGGSRSNLKNQESIMWVHNNLKVSSQTDVEELTRIEFEGRKMMRITMDYRRKNTPGFENSFVVLSDPQLGTRGARRLIGEIVCKAEDMDVEEIYKDTIAVFPDTDRFDASIKRPLQRIPYRCLVPHKVDNLLVGCRAFSSDDVFNMRFNLIPHCVALGEAAGTAAALAVKEGVKVRNVHIETLQDMLVKQGVELTDEHLTFTPSGIWQPKQGTRAFM